MLNSHSQNRHDLMRCSQVLEKVIAKGFPKVQFVYRYFKM